MGHMTNSHILELVKEITIAQISGSDKPAYEETGRDVADFMQAIYDKLNELAQNQD